MPSPSLNYSTYENFSHVKFRPIKCVFYIKFFLSFVNFVLYYLAYYFDRKKKFK